jgi:hypothetical protein
MQCRRARSKPHTNADTPSSGDGPELIAGELGWHGAAGCGVQRPHQPLAFCAVVLQTAVGRKSVSA